MTYTKKQPKHGDTILHCGHFFTCKGALHWFHNSQGMGFVRPNGTSGFSNWRVCCNPCLTQYGPNFPIKGDGEWQGDEPIIEPNGDSEDVPNVERN